MLVFFIKIIFKGGFKMYIHELKAKRESAILDLFKAKKEIKRLLSNFRINLTFAINKRVDAELKLKLAKEKLNKAI